MLAGLDRRSLPALPIRADTMWREMGILLKLLSGSEQPWWFLCFAADTQNDSSYNNVADLIRSFVFWGLQALARGQTSSCKPKSRFPPSQSYKNKECHYLKKYIKKTHLVTRSAHNKHHTRLDRDLHLKWQRIEPTWWFLKSKYRFKTWRGTSAGLTSLNLKTIRKTEFIATGSPPNFTALAEL